MDTPVTPKFVHDLLAWRYATKVFDPTRKLTSQQYAALESALVMSPSSYGMNLSKFIHVIDPKLRQQLREVAQDQPQLTDASDYIMFLARTEVTQDDVDRLVECAAKARGAPLESFAKFKTMLMGLVGRPDGFEWSARQSYIALGFLLSAAAAMQIDSCAIEGLDMAAADKILQVPAGYRCVVGCALGFRGSDDKYARLAKIRYPASEQILSR